MRELLIAGHRIADDEPPWICAEIGSNHQGSLNLARQLIDVAAHAGCDAVKFQHRGPHFLTPEEAAQPYVNRNSYGATYGEHRAVLEFDSDQLLHLALVASDCGLAFGCTAFDGEALSDLADIGVDFIKIASGGIANDALLAGASRWEGPIIASTGGATSQETRCLHENYYPDAILQCTSLYPCPPDKLNLAVITAYRDAFPDTVIGLSDHQDGIDMAVVAYCLGARIFEKHITLDRSSKGTDHAFSLEQHGLEQYVKSLRRIHEALGDGVKRRYPEEIAAVRKQGRRDL